MTMVFCWFVAVSFLISAWAKLRDIEAFRLICASYPGVSWLGIRATAASILLGEILVAVVMLLPWRPATLSGMALALSWIGIASIAIAVRRLRGERRFRCGCGTDLSEESSADWLLARNAALMAGMAATVASGDVRNYGVDEAMPGLLAALGLVLATHLLGAAAKTWWRVREWAKAG